jgi:8-oxo-dGTP pyrophosphatase MutT (NUDIX family)
MAARNVTTGPYPKRLIRVGIGLKDKAGLASEGVSLPGADVVLAEDERAGLVVPGWNGPNLLLISRGTHLHLGPGMRLLMCDEAGGQRVCGELEELQGDGMTFPLEIPVSRLNVRVQDGVSVFVEFIEVGRRAARIVVLDEGARLLLLQYARPSGATYWATPGGGLEAGESFEAAALREAAEERGVKATDIQPLWEGATTIPTHAGVMGQLEQFFLLRVEARHVVTDVGKANRREGILRMRWWTLPELQSTREVVFPENLAARVAGLVADK